MMNQVERKLFSDLLDELNLFFIDEVDFIEVYQLMFVTAKTFKNTEYSPNLDEALKAFETVRVAKNHPNLQIDDGSAITVISNLRQFLADNCNEKLNW